MTVALEQVGGAGGMEQGADRRVQRVSEPAGGDTFENLEVWKDAIELAARVYDAVRDCRDQGFRHQIQSAALSISSNIAEGYERDSNAEFIRFLFIAKGSCGEVRSQAHFGRRVGLFDESQAFRLTQDSRTLSKRLMRLVHVRRERFK